MTSNDNYIKIVLYQPRIPQNTGCIARTSAALKVELVLIEPLGFSLDDKYLKRAGLDYWPFVKINIFPNFNSYHESLDNNQRILACSKSDGINYKKFKYKNGDNLLFGREDIGLPTEIKKDCDEILSIPMPGISNSDGSNGVRSLNLSVATALISYEACSNLQIL